MLILAEICDKMPTVVGMWSGHALIAIVLIAIALSNRWAAVVAALLALACSAFIAWLAYREALAGDTFADVIWSELGTTWIVHSFASSSVPFMPTFVVAFAKWRSERRQWRIRRGLCVKCAYPVGTSEVCTECGAALHRRSMGLPPPATPVEAQRVTHD